MNNKAIRAKARLDLGGNLFNEKWMGALAAYLIYSLILGACTAIPYVGSVGSLLISGPLLFGIYGYFIKLTRGFEKPTIEGIFDGFEEFTQCFLLSLMISIFTFLWSLLFIIPGIIKSYAYSMSFYIKRDHPDWTWKQCMDESQRIMKGHKLDYFCLQFSFIGWAVLCILTCGIGTLWLSPYMLASNTNFYNELIAQNNSYTDYENYQYYSDNTY